MKGTEMFFARPAPTVDLPLSVSFTAPEAFSETAPVTSFHRLKRETHQLAGPWMSATFENRSLDSP